MAALLPSYGKSFVAMGVVSVGNRERQSRRARAHERKTVDPPSTWRARILPLAIPPPLLPLFGSVCLFSLPWNLLLHFFPSLLIG